MARSNTHKGCQILQRNGLLRKLRKKSIQTRSPLIQPNNTQLWFWLKDSYTYLKLSFQMKKFTSNTFNHSQLCLCLRKLTFIFMNQNSYLRRTKIKLSPTLIGLMGIFLFGMTKESQSGYHVPSCIGLMQPLAGSS